MVKIFDLNPYILISSNRFLFYFYKVYFRYISHGLLNRFNLGDPLKMNISVYLRFINWFPDCCCLLFFKLAVVCGLKKRLIIINSKISALTVIRNQFIPRFSNSTTNFWCQFKMLTGLNFDELIIERKQISYSQCTMTVVRYLLCFELI